MGAVLRHAVLRRGRGTVWWCLGLVGVGALLAVAYPTIRGNSELDATFDDLPPGVRALFGLTGPNGLTSPVGYLNSQLFANVLPVLLMVFAIGRAAWSVAGDEAAGTLELLLANPVSRTRVALARAAALVVLLALLTAAGAASLVALAPAVGLDSVPAGRLVQASVGCALLALAFAGVAFAVGAGTGNRSAALASAAALAVAGFLVEGLGQQVDALRPVRSVSPWHWLLGDDPLANGLGWHSWLLPLALAAGLVGLGTVLFTRRDLG